MRTDGHDEANKKFKESMKSDKQMVLQGRITSF
jgi:hypothetical protein